ncbi:MAG TPA: UMP kinase [Acidilobales archaeon]|nr:UMP kinase [Acidilobales archaeon]
MRVVIKVTGKLFNPENREKLKGFIHVLKKLINDGHKLVVVTGGGSVARSYIRLAKEFNAPNSWRDLLGIEASRLNALLIASALGDYVYSPIPRSVDEFLMAWSSGKVVVLGGLQPGQSTNAVAAVAAELINADILINATTVDGVYDKDPNKYSDAKLLPRVTPLELKKILNRQKIEAGKYELLDPISIAIIERNRTKTVIVNGLKPSNIIEVIEGKKIGTEIVFE